MVHYRRRYCCCHCCYYTGKPLLILVVLLFVVVGLVVAAFQQPLIQPQRHHHIHVQRRRRRRVSCCWTTSSSSSSSILSRRRRRRRRRQRWWGQQQQKQQQQHQLYNCASSSESNNNNMFWPTATTATADDGETRIDGDDTNDTNNNNDDNDTNNNNNLSRVLDSIVKVHCSHSEPDFLIPWQKQHQSTSTSSGFVIELLGGLDDSDNDEDDDDNGGSSASASDNSNINRNNNNRKRIMTNAHSVEYGSIVQVQKRGDERKYEAVIETIANECDLAILRVDSKQFWMTATSSATTSTDSTSTTATSSTSTLDALEFGTILPSLQDEVEVLGYPTGGDSLSITQGVVSRIEMQEYTQASSQLLAIQIDAAINAGNSGGPVINANHKVIGVAFQGLEGAENIGYVVPVTVVQHVLHDIQRNTNGQQYTGFCSLGVQFSLLENKSFRKSLGMINDDDNDNDNDNDESSLSGVMIKDVMPTAACRNILYRNDVICEVDTIPVHNDGKIPFRPGERVSLACYIQTKFVGDTVSLQVWRNNDDNNNNNNKREMTTIDVPVCILNRLVPSYWHHNKPPPYLVVAGFVFTVLSVPYLQASDAWDSYCSDDISYLLGKYHEPLQRQTDQVVILAQVLAHRENAGYHHLTDKHLIKVNGQQVRSLAHLKHLIDNNNNDNSITKGGGDDDNDDYLRLEFGPPYNQIVVLERSSLDRVTDEVCEEQSISKSYYLHSVEEEEEEEEETTRGA